MMTKLHS